MVLKVYSVPFASGGCGLVAMVLAEKQIPFELVPIDDSTWPRGPQNSRQAALQADGDLILYEGRAICRYLTEKYAGQGIPTGLQGRALFEQAASIEFANFCPQVLSLVMASAYPMSRGLPIDEAAIARGKSELSAKLEVYEVILGKQKYLGGNEFTLADLFHLCYTPSLAKEGIDILVGTGPNFKRWGNDISARPTWIKLQ
ncbi:glutathione S-transferase, partial [Mycena rosella]